MDDDMFLEYAEEFEIERLARLAKQAEHLADAVKNMKAAMTSFPEIAGCVRALKYPGSTLKANVHSITTDIYAPNPRHVSAAEAIVSADEALEKYNKIKSED